MVESSEPTDRPTKVAREFKQIYNLLEGYT